MNRWVGCIYASFLDGRSGLAGMPFRDVYNGSRCDMSLGPCSCGSWHHVDDWIYRLIGEWKRRDLKSLEDGRPI